MEINGIVDALLPVILLIVLGYALHQMKLMTDEQWRGIEQICYYVLYPALLVKTLSNAEILPMEMLRYTLMLWSVIGVMSLILLALYPLVKNPLNMSPAAFTSVFQGVTRWHGFVAMSLVGFLLGDQGIVYMAIVMATIIPLLNVINVSVLAYFAGKEVSIWNVLKQLAHNPLIIACLIGVTLNATGIGIHKIPYQVLDMVSAGALAMGLLVVGAGLVFRELVNSKALLVFGTVMRLIAMPFLTFGLAWLFDIQGDARTVAIISMAVPTATASYVLARKMGGDAKVMANLITVQVVVSAVTLPLMLMLDQYL